MNQKQDQIALFPIQDKPTKEIRMPVKLGRYDRWEVVSAFRKDIKLGNIEDAFYWTTLLLKYGGSNAKRYILKQCWIMCAEDLWSVEISNYCASIVMMEKEYGVGETDHIYALVYRMCLAPKFWESKDGRNMDLLWNKSEGDAIKQEKEIPEYALDQHTRRGKRMIAQGLPVKNYFTGDNEGRQKTVYLYKRDGKISKDSNLDSGFSKHWEEYQKMTNGEATELKPEL